MRSGLESAIATNILPLLISISHAMIAIMGRDDATIAVNSYVHIWRKKSFLIFEFSPEI